MFANRDEKNEETERAKKGRSVWAAGFHGVFGGRQDAETVLGPLGESDFCASQPGGFWRLPFQRDGRENPGWPGAGGP